MPYSADVRRCHSVFAETRSPLSAIHAGFERIALCAYPAPEDDNLILSLVFQHLIYIVPGSSYCDSSFCPEAKPPEEKSCCYNRLVDSGFSSRCEKKQKKVQKNLVSLRKCCNFAADFATKTEARQKSLTETSSLKD